MLINNLIITNNLITFTVPRTSRKRGPIRRRCMRSAASTPSRAANVSTHLARRGAFVRYVGSCALCRLARTAFMHYAPQRSARTWRAAASLCAVCRSLHVIFYIGPLAPQRLARTWRALHLFFVVLFHHDLAFYGLFHFVPHSRASCHVPCIARRISRCRAHRVFHAAYSVLGAARKSRLAVPRIRPRISRISRRARVH